MPKIEVTMSYGLDPDAPFKLSTPVIDDVIVETTEGIIYDFETAAGIEFVNSYQVASALQQVCAVEFWGVGVTVFGMNTRAWFTDDPDVYTDFPQPYDELAIPGVQVVGGGPRNRVMGMKTKVPATNATSIFACGLLRTGTAGYGDGIPLAGLPLLQKFRNFLNEANLFCITGALTVNKDFTALQDYPNRLYHGVRRAR